MLESDLCASRRSYLGVESGSVTVIDGRVGHLPSGTVPEPGDTLVGSVLTPCAPAQGRDQAGQSSQSHKVALCARYSLSHPSSARLRRRYLLSKSGFPLRAPGENVRTSSVIVSADAAGLDQASRVLRAGGVCAFPTETVYGLGADAFSTPAIAEIYRLKNRPDWNPLIVHALDADMARSLARVWPGVAVELAHRFWPGPLTLVVDRAAHVPDAVSAGTGTVALRVPAHPVALDLLAACGLPLAAPSANRSESVSPTCAQHVLRSLPDVPLIVDGGPCRWGIESTVLDITCTPPRLLRPGALPLRKLRDAIGAIDFSAASFGDGDGTARSPGQGRRHYAPRAKVVIVDDVEVAGQSGLGKPCGILTHVDLDVARTAWAEHVEVLPDDPAGYGADLYAALHRLDDRGISTIAVLAPPEDEDWMAVRDRLHRASAGPMPAVR
ncbi:L-threonylcarbamoyladenylate synthase [Streptomyces sp. NPDC050658]|uniref:L-threonylcarbamoyladenylate synthase n=1 Tax=unclassified Streptomyces TaxID=2593676 RepID=UPI0034182810